MFDNDDQESKSLWQRVAETINPLQKEDVRVLVKPAQPAPISKKANKVRSAKIPLTEEPKPNQPEMAPPPKINDAGLDGKTDARLRKGKMQIDATLDLHGYTHDEGQSAVISFLLRSYDTNKRCLLIITGKGSRSGDGVGVLKSNLPRWLSTPQLASKILRFYPAHAKHGGSGAFYVFLRRNKD